jgi:hypothetical protein
MHHVNWIPLVTILTKGSTWPLTPIENTERVQKNNEFIIRGNHKSANTYLNTLKEILEKDVNQGWMIPIPLKYLNEIPDSELAPVGIDDKQFKILPDRSKLMKYRLTHDQSFVASVGESVNKRVIKEDLNPLYYRGCLSRLIHYISSIRSRHPNIKILGGKSDIKSAYRRITLNGQTAVKCAIMCQEFSLVSLRLTFGGSPCPNEWCIASELFTDLANDILHCEDWNPQELFSPHAPTLLPPQYLNDDIPFAPAADLDVQIPDDDMGWIDDGMAIIPDIKDNKNRGIQALLLAIHISFRPLDPSEKLQCKDCLSLDKLAEEGRLSEVFIVLGWSINTRLLTLALPKKKFHCWMEDLKGMLSSRKVTAKELERLIGRLNHTGAACPLTRYFISVSTPRSTALAYLLFTKNTRRHKPKPHFI